MPRCPGIFPRVWRPPVPEPEHQEGGSLPTEVRGSINTCMFVRSQVCTGTAEHSSTGRWGYSEPRREAGTEKADQRAGAGAAGLSVDKPVGGGSRTRSPRIWAVPPPM